MNKIVKLIMGITILLISLVLLTFSYYIYQLSPTSSDETMIEIEIPKGSTGSEIATILKDKDVIKNIDVFRVYLKVHNTSNINYGIYELNKAMGVKQIVDIIIGGQVSNNDVKILFKEGQNMRGIAKTIASSTNNTEEDVFALLEDDDYINSLISKYWFLSDTIKDDEIYYPLEGYLAPNTYQFADKDVTVSEIFRRMLDQMDKVLIAYKDQFTDYTVHEYLTLASMIEQEGKTLEDRKGISSVFYNRLEIGDKLGSDVTTYYALKLDNYVRDLTTAEINTYNPYNTRGPKMSGELPVGPICASGEEAIASALEPAETDYLFFVADKNGKVYFTKTNAQHEAKIAELMAAGLWYEFE